MHSEYISGIIYCIALDITSGSGLGIMEGLLFLQTNYKADVSVEIHMGKFELLIGIAKM